LESFHSPLLSFESAKSKFSQGFMFFDSQNEEKGFNCRADFGVVEKQLPNYDSSWVSHSGAPSGRK